MEVERLKRLPCDGIGYPIETLQGATLELLQLSGFYFKHHPSSITNFKPMASSIYAESLLNLRQVTVCISLPSEADTSTTLSLSANNTVLEVHHQSHTASLELPAAVSSASSPKVPPHAKQDISLRLPFATEEPHAGPCSGQESTSAWSAQALADVEELACQACGAPWISSGPIKDWKDLPNEDWAEMMELWHCHKPHVPHAQNGDGTGGTKGYAAANKLTAQPGVGLVGVSSVLVSPEDCSGIEVCYKLYIHAISS